MGKKKRRGMPPVKRLPKPHMPPVGKLPPIGFWADPKYLKKKRRR